MNEFHPFPPWTKPSILNADLRKIQNRGNARARLQSTTDFPGSCDKMRGAEIISAAAGSASRSSEKRSSVRFAHAHVKRKIPTTFGPPCNDALGGAARARTARAQGHQAAPTRRAHLSQHATQDRRRHAPCGARRAGWRSGGRCASSKATGAARRRAARSSARGIGRPPLLKAGRRDLTAQRGERSAREPPAANARTPRSSRAPGCSAPSRAWSPTGRASA